MTKIAPRSKRRSVTVRLAETGVDRVDELAAERGIDRSAMIRALLGWSVRQIDAGKAPELAQPGGDAMTPQITSTRRPMASG
jgi:ribbon-helix-helix CopG family protein